MPNYYLQKMPKGMKKGENVVFPKMQTYTQHDYDTVLKHMRDYVGNISEGTMRAVIEALVTTMRTWMPMGHNIKVEGLGVFSLSLGFDTSTPSEKVLAQKKDDGDGATDAELKTKYRHVCIKEIRFKPDAELLDTMNREATFERVETDVVEPKKSPMSREERIARAQAVIDRNGFMTLSDYVVATGLSRTVASLDLKALVADPSAGIATHGSGSHRVWIKRQ